MLKKVFLLALILGASTLHAQSPSMLAANEGIWEGYDGEWRYVSRLLPGDPLPAYGLSAKC